jgi:hypothetical protein
MSNVLLSTHCTAVRLLEDVHAGLTALPSPAGLSQRFASGISEVSRFSCMEFPDVHGVCDYAGPTSNSRFSPLIVWPSAVVTASAP